MPSSNTYVGVVFGGASGEHNVSLKSASTVLGALQSLSGATLRVSLGELAGGQRVRLQLVEEAPDQLEPPPLS